MEADQEYISSILYHFIGRSANNDIARFETLLMILESGKLLYDPGKCFPSAIPTFQEGTFKQSGEITRVPAVCFCDIPRNQLAIHTGKYSRFGLGFSKQTLLAHGVRPVWYLPLSATSAIATSELLVNRFPTELRSLLNSTAMIIKKLTQNTDITDAHNILSSNADVQSALSQISKSHFFLLADMAWYFKFYDSSLKDSDINNFYFEREWRKVNSDFQFEHKQIEEILVPDNSFKNTLASRMPHLEEKIFVL